MPGIGRQGLFIRTPVIPGRPDGAWREGGCVGFSVSQIREIARSGEARGKPVYRDHGRHNDQSTTVGTVLNAYTQLKPGTKDEWLYAELHAHGETYESTALERDVRAGVLSAVSPGYRTGVGAEAWYKKLDEISLTSAKNARIPGALISVYCSEPGASGGADVMSGATGMDTSGGGSGSGGGDARAQGGSDPHAPEAQLMQARQIALVNGADPRKVTEESLAGSSDDMTATIDMQTPAGQRKMIEEYTRLRRGMADVVKERDSHVEALKKASEMQKKYDAIAERGVQKYKEERVPKLEEALKMQLEAKDITEAEMKQSLAELSDPNAEGRYKTFMRRHERDQAMLKKIADQELSLRNYEAQAQVTAASGLGRSAGRAPPPRSAQQQRVAAAGANAAGVPVGMATGGGVPQAMGGFSMPTVLETAQCSDGTWTSTPSEEQPQRGGVARRGMGYSLAPQGEDPAYSRVELEHDVYGNARYPVGRKLNATLLSDNPDILRQLMGACEDARVTGNRMAMQDTMGMGMAAQVHGSDRYGLRTSVAAKPE